MKALTGMLLMMILGVASPLAAAPGDGAEQARLEIIEQALATCPGRGELCLSPGASGTRAVGGAEGATRFMRILGPARPGKRAAAIAAAPDGVPWTVEVTASLRQRALSGNTLFIVYDAQDPKARAEHQVTALWQTPIRSGASVTARLVLSPADGFQAPHTYHLRVVQIIAGKHVVLASGDIRLL